MEFEKTSLGGIIRLTWPTVGVCAELSSVHRNRDHDPIAIVTVRASLNGSKAQSEVFCGRVNLMGPRAQSDLIKILRERCEEDWLNIVPTLCYQGSKLLSEGAEVVQIKHRADIDPPKYLIYPLLAWNKPNIIYGLGGSGKSIVATAIAVLVATGYRSNPLGLELMYDSGNVLVLDYEADHEEYEWRANCIMRGMNMGPEALDIAQAAIDYRHMAVPIADDIESINRLTLERGYRLIIIDSIAASVGGDLNLSDGPNRLFPALRQLNTTVLLIGHVAKNAKGETSPYGNAFFFNYARSIWELKKVQESGEDSFAVALLHRKANASKLHAKIGYYLNFTEDSVSFLRSRVMDMPGMEGVLSVTEKIKVYLNDGKKAETDMIAEAIGEKAPSVKTLLYRMATKGVVKHFIDGWALLSNVTVTPL